MTKRPPMYKIGQIVTDGNNIIIVDDIEESPIGYRYVGKRIDKPGRVNILERDVKRNKQ